MKNESRKERRKNKSKKRKGKSKKIKREKRQERRKEKGRDLRPVSYPFIYRIFRIPLLSSRCVRMLKFFRISNVCVFFV